VVEGDGDVCWKILTITPIALNYDISVHCFISLGNRKLATMRKIIMGMTDAAAKASVCFNVRYYFVVIVQ
jgi:hypothetical protein